MKRATKIINRVSGPAVSVCLACLLFFGIPEESEAQAISETTKDLVEISVIDSFSLSLRFNAYPEYAFVMWLPELAIFDSDLERSHTNNAIDGEWFEKDQGYWQVKGQAGTDKKSVVYKCILKPLSAGAMMLMLEATNAGQHAWTDYAQLAICLAPDKRNTAFSDKSGTRSFITSERDKIIPLRTAGEVGAYNHYVVGDRSDTSDSIQRAHVHDGFAARTSVDGKITISFIWENAARVDVNPGGLDCIHSHPAIGPLNPGDSKSLIGFIIINEGSAREHHSAMNNLINKYCNY